MKRMFLNYYLLSFILYLPVHASELVYTPINPSFGGNPYNASWLMQQADAQNTIQEPVEDDILRDPLEDFQESVNHQILNRLASQFTSDVFGEDAVKPGHYELGNFIIDVTEGTEGVQINILDATTGNETSIIVPYF